jgi:hypothetical protein
MTYVDYEPAECQRSLRPQRRIGRIVDVAVNSFNGCNLPERLEHRRSTDIAGMQNHLYARKRRLYCRPHETVRIGNQPDDDFCHRRRMCLAARWL